MKKLLLVFLALVAGCTTARAQNVEGQPIAAQYGSWIVHGLTPNTYSFVVPACVQQGGSKTFHPFSTVAPFAPIKIVDTNPAMTEVVTPTAAVDTNQTCSITVSPVNKHNSFYITSATGGLQEALNANRQNSNPNSIVLTQQWYAQGGSSAIINTVVGSANLSLVDVTSVPYNWYQWNGTQYVLVSIGGGGGSGAFPAGAQYSVQFNGNGSTMFGGATSTFYQPSTHSLSVGDAMIVRESIENAPRLEYDVMNPLYAGGLLAARTDPTGVQQAAVINAALDYSECQVQMGVVPAYGHIIIPSAYGTLAVSGIKVWGTNELSSPSYGDVTLLQHTDNTQPMITGHAASDSLTCSNGTTYQPLAGGGIPASQVYIHDIGIAGMGSGASGRSSDRDIGIWANGFSWIIENVVQYGNSFGSEAVLNGGTEVQFLHLGKVGGQLQGCAAYNGTTPNVPVSSSPSGHCAALEDDGLDTRADDIYASDGTRSNGPCYPNCSAIYQGAAGSRFTNLFTQISDIGINVANTGTITSNARIDGSATNAMLLFNTGGLSNNTVSNVVVTSACTDPSLASVYSAGTATQCYGLSNYAQSSAISNVTYGTSAGLFGSSYMQSLIFDNGVGGSSAPNQYSNISYTDAASNNTNNDHKFSGQFQGDYASGLVNWPAGGFAITTSTTPNVNGLTKLLVSANISITDFQRGLGGEPLQVTSNVPGASITPGGTIRTCSGAVLPIYNTVVDFVNIHGLANGNLWQELCDGGTGGGGGGTGTLNFSGTPATNSLARVTGTNTVGQSGISDTGSALSFSEPSTFSAPATFGGSGLPAQVNLIPTGVAPAAPSSGAGFGINVSVTTPNVFLAPDAPPPSGGAFLSATNATIGGNANNDLTGWTPYAAVYGTSTCAACDQNAADKTVTTPQTFAGGLIAPSMSTNGAVNGADTYGYTGTTPYSSGSGNTLPANSLSYWLGSSPATPIVINPDVSPTTGFAFDTVTSGTLNGVSYLSQVQDHILPPTCSGSQASSFNGTSFTCVSITPGGTYASLAGANNFTVAANSGIPALEWTGTHYPGTTPDWYIDPSATSCTGYSTNGTNLAICPSTALGNMMDMVSAAGHVTFTTANGSFTTPGFGNFGGNLTAGGNFTESGTGSQNFAGSILGQAANWSGTETHNATCTATSGANCGSYKDTFAASYYSSGAVATAYSLSLTATPTSGTAPVTNLVLSNTGAPGAVGFQAALYNTTSPCSGGSASPAACGASLAGKVQIAVGATTEVINSTSVTSNTECWFVADGSYANPANMASIGPIWISARTAGTSITISVATAPTTNPLGVGFGCQN